VFRTYFINRRDGDPHRAVGDVVETFLRRFIWQLRSPQIVAKSRHGGGRRKADDEM
jgi:hypothetical protein